MDLIFTDLDGTLLDHDTYDWQPARPALESLRRRGVPWIVVSSKTRAEIEYWRARLDNAHPFIVENGGAVYIPRGYFPAGPAGAAPRDSYLVIELGTPYRQLAADLLKASQACGCRVRGFQAMPVEEVAERCGLPLEQARLAKQREYDEPFIVLDAGCANPLATAIVALGRRWTRGGRFWHILGANDKAAAVHTLTSLYRQGGRPLRTIGLGDGLNDAAFLHRVDVPVIVHSPRSAELKRHVPRATVTALAGPAGWNHAVLALIDSPS
jgi:mannosyl-3-phosphoglycerate phosphatase